VSKATIRADMRNRIFIIGLETLLMILAISLTSIAITTRWIIRPLHALQTSADHLAQGQLDQAIETSRRDELGLLAHSFVNMRDAIREKIVALNQVNADLSQEITERKRIETELRRHQDHLEDLVCERTSELMEANEKLQQDIAERKRAEDALRKSEERFRQVAENVGEWIWEVDVNGLYHYTSPVVEKILGYTPDELVWKMHFYDLFAPHVREALKASALEVFARKEPFRVFQNPNITKNGRTVILETSGVPMLDELGNLIGYRGTDTDVTERKQAEEALRESERKYRVLFESAREAIFAIDADGNFTVVNPAMVAILGYASPQELIGKSVSILYANPEDLTVLFKELQTTGFVENYEATLLRKDGTLIYTLGSGFLHFDDKGQILQAEGIFMDITERKRAEEALQQAKEAAEAANLAKSTFLANMSHELRTPLNVMLGFTQILARMPHTPEEQEHLAIIQRSGEHLLTLINQVLDLSKIEAGQMTLSEHTVDLYDLFEDMQDLFSLKARNKGLQLLVDHTDDVPRYVRTDEIKLRQVLINLLNNAIKFTEQGAVSLHVARASLADGRLPSAKHQQVAPDQQASIVNLQFLVTDTGPGIAPEEKGKVFEIFVQTEIGRQTQEGTGLGLAISQKFVQLMGGDITVHSEVGRGTTFTIVIQCQSVDAMATPQAPMVKRVIAVAPDQPRYRLLVVDDKPDNRALLVTLLNPFGFDLRDAENGQEAIEIWTHWNPHLIWMDLRMPVIDGYEATKRIRNEELSMKHEEFKTVIIAVTASSFEEEQRSVLSAGCDALLRKPFREAEVFEILHRHLGVEFVYAEDEWQKAKSEGRKGADMLTPGDLAVLSSELLKKLAYAAITTNVVQLTSLIGGFQAQHPGLANALMQMVDNFEYPALLAIIEATLKTC
jgi:PAS domain S-box-containing protein